MIAAGSSLVGTENADLGMGHHRLSGGRAQPAQAAGTALGGPVLPRHGPRWAGSIIRQVQLLLRVLRCFQTNGRQKVSKQKTPRAGEGDGPRLGVYQKRTVES